MEAAARLATKVLLVVLLEAVEAGAALAAVEAMAASGPAGATTECARAALELLCTVVAASWRCGGRCSRCRSLCGWWRGWQAASGSAPSRSSRERSEGIFFEESGGAA
ncbi:hypothetical protein SEVIR_3G156201v4 [Setaria viridis]|uniref:Secreted protein n=1 Tax=Setaria viridis TaxID=4556 RepID=A0A4U6VFB6_SETVI|nr:hypothetical protein SEVIR_3G156201v2 [Setaria viridis]